MRAIRVNEFGPPEVMRLEEVPDAHAVKGQVLVRVKAAGVNPVDVYIRSGSYARKPALPYTPGSDAAGLVEAVGEGVSRFRPGARVYTAGSLSGTYAELAVCEESQVQPLPERVSFTQGAGVFVPYGTAYRALFQLARARAAETVLVHGASGGVGVAAVQLARAAGMRVIGTAGTEKGLRLVEAEGAHHAINHREPNYLDRALALTGGRGVDLILEMLANVNLGKDLPLLAQNGRVVVIGSRGTVEINPRDLMMRDGAVMGMALLLAPPAEMAALHAGLVAGLENGTLRPVIGREMPLGEAPQAHQAVMDAGAFGKIVLLP